MTLPKWCAPRGATLLTASNFISPLRAPKCKPGLSPMVIGKL